MDDQAEPNPLHRLIADNQSVWRAYIDHDFVRGLGDGSLPEAAFKKYLLQDYLFLIQCARAYALAAYKADRFSDIQAASAGLHAIVDMEMDLHVQFSEGWGLSRTDMEAEIEDPACIAYTRYVLDRGMAGDLLDLHVALAPCIWGYGEIGLKLAKIGSAHNPYQPWIDMYAGADYQSAAEAERDHMTDLYGRLGGADRFGSLSQTFHQATRLEVAFWDMGWQTGREASP